jgi:2-dehydropantoate 2-reductase
MGSIYAGLLADAGNDVWVVDTWEEHVAAIREHGLRVEGASGERTVRVGATTRSAEVGEVDLVVVATKAMDVRAAALAAGPLVGETTLVLPIQNGLGSVETAAEVFGSDARGNSRVIVGVAGGFGASVTGPGAVHHEGMELLRLGERRGPATARLERVAEVWRAAGFTVRTYDDADVLVWEKLVCNVCFSATCALLDLTVGDAMDDPHAWSVASRCAVEAFEVALALGVALPFDDPVEHVRAFGSRIPGAHPSLLLDLKAGRRTEIDVINGAIPLVARTVRVATPVNETVTALVKGLEARSLAAATPVR